MRTTINTKAIVLSSFPLRERSVMVSLLTEDMGYVRAIADGVRSTHSKLAPALVATSYGTYTLVRGSHDWRIRGGKEEGNAFYELSKESWEAYRFILSLLTSALHGEEHTSLLFNEVEALYESLLDPLTPSGAATLLAELRILSLFGVCDAKEIPSIARYGEYGVDALRAVLLEEGRAYELVKKGREALEIPMVYSSVWKKVELMEPEKSSTLARLK